jgi:LuxR family maltose regulon positive regulatory protein
MAEPVCFSQEWLGAQRAFAFHGRNGQLNVLKEKRSRGGEGYWYAYRRHGRQMSKHYLGRDAQVSIERLEEIAALLARGVEAARVPGERSAEATGQNLFLEKRSLEAELTSDQNAPALAGDVRISTFPDTEPADSTTIAGPGSWPSSLFFEPLLRSKFQLPRLQKALLEREHLLAILDRGLEHKVILVDAPAGYGKTTLISQWLATRATRADFPRVVSISLDNNDNDPIRFWRYIITACQTFAPGVGKEALDTLLTYRLPPFQFKPLEIMLIPLLNELSQLEQRGILILDDLHVIQSPQVIASLGFFLEHLPSALHLLLVMRGDPPFSLMRLRAHNELLAFPTAALGFTLEETRDFFARELPFELSPRMVRELYQRLEGWPAGMRLFSGLLSRCESEREIEETLAAFVGNHWSLREYFLGEVLLRLPDEQQEFLLQTSVLPRLTAALCDALMARKDSARLIETLRSGDFFLIPLDGMGEWLRYHALFAETMQQEARRRLGDARLNELAIGASLWYEEHGLQAEAIETALNAGAFPRASSLIAYFIEKKYRDNAFVFLEIYHLKRWLEALPEDELKRHPIFCLHYAMILLFTQAEKPRVQAERERVYSLLQEAEQRWRDANDTAQLAAVFAFRAMLARQEGRMLQALTWARQALAWLRPEDLIWRTIALTVVGIGESLVGTLTRAREVLLEARLLNERLGNATYARAARGMLTWVHLEQGELHYAAEQFRQMQAEARAQEDRDDIARTQLGLSHILYQWDRLQEAEQAVYEAQRLAEQISEDELLYAVAARLARIEYARGQSAQAQQRLTAWLARNQVFASPQQQQFYREAQALLASIQLARGDRVAVERWFAGLDQRAEIIPLYQRQRERLLVARLFLAQGKQREALDVAEALLKAARETGHRAFELDILIVRLLIYARQDQRAKAREQLRAVLTVARSEGYVRLFLDEGETMAELLRGLLPHLREQTLATYARDLLAVFAGEKADISQEQVAPQNARPESLSSQEQKVLRLLVAGNSNAEIARELVVSINTVRSQVQSIYRKLGVNNRVQASSVARQLDLL